MKIEKIKKWKSKSIWPKERKLVDKNMEKEGQKEEEDEKYEKEEKEITEVQGSGNSGPVQPVQSDRSRKRKFEHASKDESEVEISNLGEMSLVEMKQL